MGDEIEVPFVVLSHEDGLRADVFLARRLRRMSRSRAAEIVRQGNLRKVPGGLLEKPATRVFEGDELFLKRKKLEEAPSDDLEIPIVHQDEHLVAVSKPGNLVVHPTASAYHRTLIRIMRSRLEDDTLDLAHRIDKETSGLVIMVRDPAIARAMTHLFAGRDVEKSYLAVVKGVPPQDDLHLDQPMRLRPQSESGVIMEIGGEGALPSLTMVRVLARGEGAALVEARPKTGRQHQIRLHLAHAGLPIVGDKLYLGGEAFFIRALQPHCEEAEVLATVGHPRQALHAHSARLTHPVTKAPLFLVAPPPPDFYELLERSAIPLSEELRQALEQGLAQAI
ncbi:MAG: RluA family pseudouridine synthase [Deltaproteobacteria bacterium]|nr:RluA family pseudouridine synthase [Deltaproteobacteria bacterium]